MLLKRYDLYWVHEKKEELSKNRLLTTHSQLSWGHSFHMLGSYIWYWWRHPRLQFVPEVLMFLWSNPLNLIFFFDCIRCSLQYSYCCFWRCWILAGFAYNMGLRPPLSYLLIKLTFGSLLASLIWFMDLLYSMRLYLYLSITFHRNDKLRNNR